MRDVKQTPLAQEVHKLEQNNLDLTETVRIYEDEIRHLRFCLNSTMKGWEHANYLLKTGNPTEAQPEPTHPGEFALSTAGRFIVSARHLYEVLGFDTSNWKRWYEKNIINNPFALENQDWVVFVIKTKTPEGGRPTDDFMITMDLAKKLSMLARTANGEKVRVYFLECEMAAKGSTPKPSRRGVRDCKPEGGLKADGSAESMLKRSEVLTTNPLDVLTDKVDYVEHLAAHVHDDYYSIQDYAALRNLNIHNRTAQSAGKKATAECKESGWPMGWMKHEKYGRVNTYPRFVLERIFNQIAVAA